MVLFLYKGYLNTKITKAKLIFLLLQKSSFLIFYYSIDAPKNSYE